MSDRARIDDENTISTNSNLNYSTLREVLTTIGIDCSSFELKENLIDAQLLNFRNNIAHGQELQISKGEYELLHHEIFNMIVEINNRIQNAAVTQAFKKVANTRL